MDAEFDFSKIQYDYSKCDDRLFSSLNDFFHNALAVYYADRYQSMQEVVEQLQEIEKYADLMIPRIYSTQIAKPKIFYGREREFGELDRLLANPDYNCLFVTGMGGIGKSAFIREYLARCREKFDTILYVHYKGSIEATVSNDNNIEINTLRQDEEAKNGTRYFDKKLQKIRELVRGTSSVLVIDNFTGDVDNDLRALLSTELKIILLSRKAPFYQSCQEMKLASVSDLNALRRIFEDNLGRSITDYEQDSFKHILKRVEGHTLVLELMAKQIASSHITISSAASLTDEHGFSAIAPERVDYEKDSEQTSDTIGSIIDALFEANVLSAEKKSLMKVASLLGDNGIDINQFQQIMKLVSKDDLNELIKDGWLMISSDMISMHRVIQEAVHRWEWIPEYVNAAEQFLTYFYVEIRLESTKNNYPKKLRKYMTAADAELPLELKDKWIFQKLIAHRDRSMKKIDRWREKQFAKRGIIGQVSRERYIRRFDDSPADIEKLSSLLIQSEDILRQCKREPAIKSNDVYINLLYVTVLNTLQYREDYYLLTEASNIFSKAENDFVMNGASELFDSESSRNPVTIMMLHAKVFDIYVTYGNIEKAKDQLGQAKRMAEKIRHPKVYALYYSLLSDYYDIVLDGFYDTEDFGKERLLNKMLDAIEKTLKYSKRGLSYDINHLYAKNLLAKATVLMRSGRGTEKEVNELIESAKKIIDDNASTFADVQLQYYLVHARYYVDIRRDIQMANLCIKVVEALSRAISATDYQKILDVTIPCANIYYELQCYDDAISLLQDGIKLCSNHANADSYARIKQELCEHLWEVGIEAQQFELCQKTIELIEAENKEIVAQKNRVVIPNEVRNIITSKIT